jgi:site-specific DNA recombinase
MFKGQLCPGEHQPILDRDVFQAVQRKLADQHNGYRAVRAKSKALLIGRIRDDRGNRMTPSHSRNGSARYRYYVSSALIQGQPETAGSVARAPAAKVEAIVVDALRRHLGGDAPIDDAELIASCVHQIEVRQTEIAISLLTDDQTSDDEEPTPVLAVPWRKLPCRRHRHVIVPETASPTDVLPMRSETGPSSSPRSHVVASGWPKSRPAP